MWKVAIRICRELLLHKQQKAYINHADIFLVRTNLKRKKPPSHTLVYFEYIQCLVGVFFLPSLSIGNDLQSDWNLCMYFNFTCDQNHLRAHLKYTRLKMRKKYEREPTKKFKKEMVEKKGRNWFWFDVSLLLSRLPL